MCTSAVRRVLLRTLFLVIFRAVLIIRAQSGVSFHLASRNLIQEVIGLLFETYFTRLVVVVVSSTPRSVETVDRNIQTTVVDELDTLAPELDTLLEVDLLDDTGLVADNTSRAPLRSLA